MIAVDTSALLAILLAEPESDACIAALEAAPAVLISAGTLAEALIVAQRRNIGAEMAALVADLGFTVLPVATAEARRVAEAYARWGEGRHPAGLNVGDCFAYAVARDFACPLLYVGADFARTDLAPAAAA
jgi:ribonuclease VapC